MKLFRFLSKKGRLYFTIFYLRFKDYNFDYDRTIRKRKGSTVYVDTYLIPEDECCPNCASRDVFKNGHVIRTVKDCTDSSDLYIVKIHIQCYKCKKCSTIFREKEDFSMPNESISKRSFLVIFDMLKLSTNTFESIARNMHLSRQNIIDLFDRYIDYKPGKLPVVQSWDEKHINKSITDDAYLFNLVDFKTLKIFDILPNRHKRTLIAYFNRFSADELKNVEYITMDMYEPYLDVAKMFFKRAKIAIDSFHVMEHVNNAMNKVRIKIMQKDNNKAEDFDKNHVFYKLLKKYHLYFLKDIDDISSNRFYVYMLHGWYDKYSLMKYMLNIDESLKTAYHLVCEYREFNKTSSYEKAEERLNELIDLFYESKIKEFVDVSITLYTWKEYIINSFIIIPDALSKPKKIDEEPMPRRLSSGGIEGLNSILQKLNMNGNGYTNFNRFKNRAIYIINKDVSILNKPLSMEHVKKIKHKTMK